MLKGRDLREETTEELSKRLNDMTEQLFKLRFQKTTGQLEDIHKLANVRKDLARVKTVINEKARKAQEN